MNATGSAKVSNLGIGGAVAVIILGTLGVFFPEQVALLPTGFEAAIAAAITTAFGAFGADPE